jgi:hypothetical protein
MDKNTIKRYLIKIDSFLKEYSWIINTIALIVMWILVPEVRWIYPYLIIGLIILTIIFAPVLTLIVIITPLLWISEKIKGWKHG